MAFLLNQSIQNIFEDQYFITLIKISFWSLMIYTYKLQTPPECPKITSNDLNNQHIQ